MALSFENLNQIFSEIVNKTENKSHALKSFEFKKVRLSMPLYWNRIVKVLDLEPATEFEALKILWRLSNFNFKITANLLFKLSAACLILAEKLVEDSVNTIESYSMVSGVSIRDLNILQIKITTVLDFSLFTSPQQLKTMPILLQQHCYSAN